MNTQQTESIKESRFARRLLTLRSGIGAHTRRQDCEEKVSQDPEWLPRVWAVFLLLLAGSTWRLWIGASGYPAVPMIGGTDDLQRPLSLLLFVGIGVGCLIAGTGLFRSDRAWWLVSACLLGSFVLDQHRLQPWAYQAAIVGIVFATMPQEMSRRWIGWLAASIYLYSGLGKLDYQFAHTVGQDFLRPLFTLFGGAERWDETQRAMISLAMPAIELIVGVGLLIRQTYRVAGCCVVLMHLTLVILLGPLGFDHSNGVILWNMLLGVTAWMIFIRRTARPPDRFRDNPQGRHRLRWFAKALVVTVMVMPIFERLGYWDHWPSWALYSPHNSRVKLEIHSSVAGRLPTELVVVPTDQRGWINVDLDAWSLRSRGAPIYPQARYQVALAIEIADAYDLGDGIRLIEQGVADRWTGVRDERVAIGVEELRRLLDRYWLQPGTFAMP